ncbi:helix-hairpin-helix domain-containing protein [uncultured Anaerolinea sp.]|uniref:helix-hairpin-helix domain-containing protein n=1 Tax=uncultured Anaerolinea sp. TaxID=430695 RepID=UPI00262F1268|nr:helix-hairpin-helix domain-containing protein [uncultured Anaerolinea sp.]
MFYNENVDTFEKMRLLQSEMRLEVAEDVSLPGSPLTNSLPDVPSFCPADFPISTATLPNGKKIPLLKSLLTSACERNCHYCPFRMGRDFRRITFKPEELAKAVVDLTTRGVIQGAFLSSGIAGGGLRTQDRLLATAEILRKKYQYQGYLHLKIMPGAEYDQVVAAMQLADRVSINLEGPNTQRLQALAPQKIFFDELLEPLRWIEKIRQTLPPWQGWKSHWPSSTTQFVVGAVGESDLELLSVTAWLYQKVRLGRAYFSGFSPTSDTPFEDRPACSPWREHRLYQASFLLRDYGFDVEDLPFTREGYLPLETDPKLAWAQTHLIHKPVEINRAEAKELLRVPGIGPKTAQAILSARRNQRIKSEDDLKRLGVPINRAAPFLLVNGRLLQHQLRLW